MEEEQPKGFKRAEKKAKELLGNQEKLDSLIKSAKEKSKKKSKQLKSVWNEFQTLLRLLKAYWKKEYRETPWRTILYATAALIYFVNPLDLIPDFIPMTGLLDDISIITFVISSIKTDLDKFKEWEKEKLNTSDE
ncbi:MAG: YkvA family protein [Vicingaceae bacterium]